MTLDLKLARGRRLSRYRCLSVLFLIKLHWYVPYELRLYVQPKYYQTQYRPLYLICPRSQSLSVPSTDLGLVSRFSPLTNFAKTYVDAIEQNALSRRVSGLSGGGGVERSQRRVDGSFSSTWLRLEASSTGGGGGWRGSGDYTQLLNNARNQPWVGFHAFISEKYFTEKSWSRVKEKTISSATAEKQRVSCTRLSRLANRSCKSLETTGDRSCCTCTTINKQANVVSTVLTPRTKKVADIWGRRIFLTLCNVGLSRSGAFQSLESR